MIQSGKFWLFASAIIGLLILFFWIILPADAAYKIPEENNTIYVVDTTDDLPDFTLTDGLCQTQQGYCSLRAAIQQANHLIGDATIQLPTGTFTLTRTGAGEDLALTGDLDIRDNLTIQGSGKMMTIIDANEIDRVFHIIGGSNGITVTLEKMTIRNGKLTGMYDSGAGILFSNYSGGWLPGSLTLDYVDVINNHSSSTGDGGGIYNGGILILNNSTVEYNTAEEGGGIGNSYIMTSTLSTIQHNSAYRGGGIDIEGPDLSTKLVQSIVMANSTEREGGGIYFLGAGKLDISGSYIGDNYAGAGGSDGGGIYASNAQFQGAPIHVSLTSTSIVNNHAGDNINPGGNGGDGGGIYFNYDGGPLGTLTLTNSVVSGNTAGDAVGGGADGGDGGSGGGIFAYKSTVTISNSSISGNRAGNGSNGTSTGGNGGMGGGIHVDSDYYTGGTLNISRSTIGGNRSGDGGGGPANYFSPAGGGGGISIDNNWNATIDSSTISKNHTGICGAGPHCMSGDGGGIYVYYTSATVNSSTLSGNYTGGGSGEEAGRGGAIYLYSSSCTLNNSTVTDNEASLPTSAALDYGFTVSGSILANNSPADCLYLVSSAYNLVETACVGITSTDIVGIDPKLGTLMNNGGPTKTHALLFSSPALEAGDPASCPTSDQRGLSRPVDNDGDNSAVCDIGSFESQSVEMTTVSSFVANQAYLMGATGVTITTTLGSTDPMTTTVTMVNEPPGGYSLDPGEMAVVWDIDAEVDSGLNLDLQFCYTDQQLGSLEESALQAYRNSGSGWELQGGVVNETQNCLNLNGVTDLSLWTLATSMPQEQRYLYLPIARR